MAQGLSTKLPLTRSPDDGCEQNKTFQQLVKQNFLMLLLTNQGERMMIPDFGIGLKSYLFETDSIGLRSELSSKIRSQVNKYLSYVKIINLEFNSGVGGNFLSIKIEYEIIPLNFNDSIEVAKQENDIITLTN